MLGAPTVSLPDCRPLLSDPDDLTLVFQPIVDLAAATIAGYEALARFPGTAGPEIWVHVAPVSVLRQMPRFAGLSAVFAEMTRVLPRGATPEMLRPSRVPPP